VKDGGFGRRQVEPIDALVAEYREPESAHL